MCDGLGSPSYEKRRTWKPIVREATDLEAHRTGRGGLKPIVREATGLEAHRTRRGGGQLAAFRFLLPPFDLLAFLWSLAANSVSIPLSPWDSIQASNCPRRLAIVSAC